MAKLRRAQKLLDNETTLNILNDTEYGTLALISEDGRPYAVPMNYVFKAGIIYFHCAQEGFKLECISNCQSVCFNVLSDCGLLDDFNYKFKSVTISGEIRRLEDECEKLFALKELCLKYYDPSDEMDEYIIKNVSTVTVLKLNCREICGKGN